MKKRTNHMAKVKCLRRHMICHAKNKNKPRSKVKKWKSKKLK